MSLSNLSRYCILPRRLWRASLTSKELHCQQRSNFGILISGYKDKVDRPRILPPKMEPSVVPNKRSVDTNAPLVDGYVKSLEDATKSNNVDAATTILRAIAADGFYGTKAKLFLPSLNKIISGSSTKVPSLEWMTHLCGIGAPITDKMCSATLMQLFRLSDLQRVSPAQSHALVVALANSAYVYGRVVSEPTFAEAVLRMVDDAASFAATKAQAHSALQAFATMGFKWDMLSEESRNALLTRIAALYDSVDLERDLEMLCSMDKMGFRVDPAEAEHAFVYSRAASLAGVRTRFLLSEARQEDHKQLVLLMHTLSRLGVQMANSPQQFRTAIEAAVDAVVRSSHFDGKNSLGLDGLYPNGDHRWRKHMVPRHQVSAPLKPAEPRHELATVVQVSPAPAAPLVSQVLAGLGLAAAATAAAPRVVAKSVVTRTVTQMETVETFEGGRLVSSVSKPKTVTRTVTETVEDVVETTSNGSVAPSSSSKRKAEQKAAKVKSPKAPEPLAAAVAVDAVASMNDKPTSTDVASSSSAKSVASGRTEAKVSKAIRQEPTQGENPAVEVGSLKPTQTLELMAPTLPTVSAPPVEEVVEEEVDESEASIDEDWPSADKNFFLDNDDALLWKVDVPFLLKPRGPELDSLTEAQRSSILAVLDRRGAFDPDNIRTTLIYLHANGVKHKHLRIPVLRRLRAALNHPDFLRSNASTAEHLVALCTALSGLELRPDTVNLKYLETQLAALSNDLSVDDAVAVMRCLSKCGQSWQRIDPRALKTFVNKLENAEDNLKMESRIALLSEIPVLTFDMDPVSSKGFEAVWRTHIRLVRSVASLSRGDQLSRYTQTYYRFLETFPQGKVLLDSEGVKPSDYDWFAMRAEYEFAVEELNRQMIAFNQLRGEEGLLVVSSEPLGPPNALRYNCPLYVRGELKGFVFCKRTAVSRLDLLQRYMVRHHYGPDVGLFRIDIDGMRQEDVPVKARDALMSIIKKLNL